MQNRLITLLLAVVFISGCAKNEEQKRENTESKGLINQHKVTVQEVIQVTEYTYLRVTEEEKEYWMATPKAEFKVGEVLLYDNAMEMKNFTSKDLNKTFDSILFIDNASIKLGEGSMTQPMKPVIKKEELSLEPASGGITIAQLFADPQSYSNKKIKIKGKVVKVNNGIMKKNWIHIQDGTKYKDDFDLTVTTNDLVKIGDVVLIEGKIVLNKDFGYGYSYNVLLEDARVSKNL
jgi:hypothetical protein